jgi:hypothetical protein
MTYPTPQQVELADREQIYRWFLLLPFPKHLKIKEGKIVKWVWSPEYGREIMLRVHKRWEELGGTDPELRNKILSEEKSEN